MSSASAVADWFLHFASRRYDAELTNLKLQKLLYYAQGAHLERYGRPLFPEPIEAWEHGPVVPLVYILFATCGRTALPVPTHDPQLTSEEVEVVVDVWNEHGRYSAWELRERSHRESPWLDAYQPGNKTRISNESIKRFFVAQASEEFAEPPLFVSHEEMDWLLALAEESDPIPELQQAIRRASV